MSIINLELINNGTEITEVLPVKCFVYKHIERIIYSKDIDSRNIPIAYFQGDEPDSWKNIKLIDKSYLAPRNHRNKILKKDSFLTYNSSSFISDYRYVLITNQKYTSKEGLVKPLFWRHKLKAHVVEVEVVKVSNGSEISVEDGFQADYAVGYIYTNYQNVYSYEKDSYVVFFISAVDKDGNKYNELLNPEPAIPELTWDLIDLETGEPKEISYSIVDQIETFEFRIHTTKSSVQDICEDDSGEGIYFVKLLDDNSIRPLLPSGRTIYDPWNIRFTNGSFFETIGVGDSVVTKKYWIPEFSKQSFNPIFGVLHYLNQKSTFVDSNLIKLPRKNLYIDLNEGIHLSLFIYNEEKIIYKVLTTDSSLNGKYYSNTQVKYEFGGIESFDKHKGFIHTNIDIHPSQYVYASFFCKVEDYSYNTLSLNPTQEKRADIYKWVFYIIPISGSVTGKDLKAIHCIGVDKDNYIVFCSQDETFEGAYDCLSLYDQNGFYNPNTIIGLKYESSSSVNFVDEYTFGKANNYQYLILAEAFIVDSSELDDALVYDVRRYDRIKSEKFDDLVRRNSKILQSEYGYGLDGQPVPTDNVVVFEMPDSLIDTHGGELSSTEAENLLSRFLPAGITRVFEREYLNPKVVLSSVAANTVVIDIRSEGPGTYNIWRRLNLTEEKSLVTSIVKTDAANITHSDAVVGGNVYYYSIRVNTADFGAEYGVRSK